MNISICMATYNGSRYLRQQLDSILAQMQVGDELIVLDDASEDDTLAIVQAYGDPRIQAHRNKVNLGHVQSFSNAFGLANHPYLVMADQDDVWADGRLARIRDALALPSVWLLTGNSKFINAAGRGIEPVHPDLDPADSRRHCINIMRIFTGKAFYFGCNMAFRKELVPLVLPIPTYVESHDLWIAMAGNLVRANLHLSDVLLYRRIHGGNVTVSNRSLVSKLRSRIVFFRSLLHLLLRRRRVNPVSF